MINNEYWDLAKKHTEKIQGWLSNIENKFLFDTAKKLKGTGVIVEIGSWKGRSTICLALGSKAGNQTKVYAIDPHTGSPDLLKPGEKIWTYDEFIQNLKNAGVENLVTPIISTAEKAILEWRLPIELIFIDANYHSYELTKKLFLEWQKHIIEGGGIALNNVAPSFSAILQNKPLYGLPGPRKTAYKFILKSNNFKNFKLAGCILYAEKCAKNTLLDKFSGWVMKQKINFLYLILWFYKCLTRLPQPIKTTFKKILLSK